MSDFDSLVPLVSFNRTVLLPFERQWQCFVDNFEQINFCKFFFLPFLNHGKFETISLFFSVDIMVFDFPHFVFFQVQYIHYCWKHYLERLHRNCYTFFMEVIIWKENKEVGTICFEIRIPMKKPKIFMEFFYVSFWKKKSIFGFSNFIVEENKNIYGDTFIPWKSQWNIGLMLKYFFWYQIYYVTDLTLRASFCVLRKKIHGVVSRDFSQALEP